MQNTTTKTNGTGVRIATAATGTLAIALGVLGAATGSMHHPAQRARTVQSVPPAKAMTPRPVRAKTGGMAMRDMKCLASAIWHEAGNQPREGRIAVAEVVLTRTRSGKYPKRPCAVVAQKQQFSFVVKGIVPSVPLEHVDEIMDIARGVVDGTMHSRVRGAMWFHATYSRPNWNIRRVGQIGEHIFYGAKA